MSSIAPDGGPLAYALPLIGAALFVAISGCHSPAHTAQAPARDVSAATQEPREAAPPAKGAKESVRAPVQPTPAESRTPEEAAKRAADPKDPSGALIVEPAKPVR